MKRGSHTMIVRITAGALALLMLAAALSALLLR